MIPENHSVEDTVEMFVMPKMSAAMVVLIHSDSFSWDSTVKIEETKMQEYYNRVTNENKSYMSRIPSFEEKESN